MARNCYYCHGDGSKRNGDTCHVCGGSGDHPEWEEKYCDNCGDVIEYHVDWVDVSDTCNSCRQERRSKWRDTECDDCGDTIHYHVDWDRIPDLCRDCIQKRKAQWRTTTCKDCGDTVPYHVDWSSIPDICKSCRKKRRTKWHYKSCSHCGEQIRYHEDWERVSDYCKKCNEPLTKPCPSCSGTVRYKVWWDNPPNRCRDCNRTLKKPCITCPGEVEYRAWWDNPPAMCGDCYEDKTERVMHLREGSPRITFSGNEELPYIGNTPNACGFHDAVVYFDPNIQDPEIEEAIHVTLRGFEGMEELGLKKEAHISYYLNPETGEPYPDKCHSTFYESEDQKKPFHTQIDIRDLMG